MSLMDHIEKMMEANSPFEIEDIQTDEYSYDSIKTLLSEYVKDGYIRRYSQGIYYIPKNDLFGEMKPSFEDVIKKKYMCSNNNWFGYLTGVAFLNEIGLSMQVPAVLEVTTNKETNLKRTIEINGRRAILRKTNIMITNENVRYLQFLDVFRYASYEMIRDHIEALKNFFKLNNLNIETLKKCVELSTRNIRKAIRDLSIYDELTFQSATI